MKALRDHVSDFSGHSLDEIFSAFFGHSVSMRCFQIILEIVSGRHFTILNLGSFFGSDDPMGSFFIFLDFFLVIAAL